MSVSLEYHAAVLPEVELIKISYEENRVGLGAEFLAELMKFLLAIADNPRRFAVVKRQERIARMFQFPYLIRFRILKDGRIRILSVIHSARVAGDWTRRR
ncbi:type II toxin-antitoxin system RelE/ParE family toxin [Anatilimnocola floriformis]|uniref:type II toxin-antitoxin system RelE/ParE family toxin n=1 Tax=Anatilimnocola floriformis TaxID=2948575 RepID=UPI0020C1D0F3|nr:type II toxin-antitoxin system RelE/ParE family toxin [Anatilimnocola floriformis]